MAKKAAAENAATPIPRRRLSAEEKAGIEKELEAGATGQAIAEKFGTSVATVYAVRKKTAPKASGQASESPLRQALVSWAVRTLLDQPVSEGETADLKAKLQAEMMQRILVGL